MKKKKHRNVWLIDLRCKSIGFYVSRMLWWHPFVLIVSSELILNFEQVFDLLWNIPAQLEPISGQFPFIHLQKTSQNIYFISENFFLYFQGL